MAGSHPSHRNGHVHPAVMWGDFFQVGELSSSPRDCCSLRKSYPSIPIKPLPSSECCLYLAAFVLRADRWGGEGKRAASPGPLLWDPSRRAASAAPSETLQPRPAAHRRRPGCPAPLLARLAHPSRCVPAWPAGTPGPGKGSRVQSGEAAGWPRLFPSPRREGGGGI